MINHYRSTRSGRCEYFNCNRTFCRVARGLVANWHLSILKQPFMNAPIASWCPEHSSALCVEENELWLAAQSTLESEDAPK